MGILVTILTTGKGTWREVSNLINLEDWNKIYIITNEFGEQNFKCEKEINIIKINTREPIKIIRDKIINELKDLSKEIGFNDVAINLTSGTGKEHMALMSAMMKLGTGIRVITTENDEIKNL